MLDAKRARKELHELRNSMEYAYAMGHGCSIGGAHPTFDAIRQRAKDLRAVVAEHDVGG
jgi:hypothetical protein